MFGNVRMNIINIHLKLVVTFISLQASETTNLSLSFKVEFRIGQLNYEMICHAENLAEAVFFIKIPVSILVSIDSQNNSGT